MSPHIYIQYSNIPVVPPVAIIVLLVPPLVIVVMPLPQQHVGDAVHVGRGNH